MRALAVAVLALVLAGTSAAGTIRGTKRGELLPGTNRADLIVAGGGRDVVDALGGDDRIVLQYDGAVDGVSCGAGRDIVTADLADRTTADCEVVSRRLSRDIHANAESQHETQVEPDSLTFGRTTVAAFQSGRRRDGGSANTSFATSTDDGRTWRAGELPGLTRQSPRPGHFERASDPVVAYDALHGTWLVVSLVLEPGADALVASRSPNGFAWSDPVAISSATAPSLSHDKEWIACDNGTASPFRGRCYVAYNDTARDGLTLLTSGDGGLTWAPPVTIPLVNIGAFPVIRPDGTLVIVMLTPTDDESMVAVSSHDGGATLEPPVTIAPVRASRTGDLRGPEIPSADVDASGRIWIAWHDCSRRKACLANDILVSSSTDGLAWTAPTRITSGRDARTPALAIEPVTGRIGVLHYAIRPAGIDAELIESRDAGRTWSTARRLSAQTMRFEWLANGGAPFLGDYISLSYAAGRPLAVWALASEPFGIKLRQAIYATKF